MTPTFLTPEQRAAFERDGVLRLEGLLPEPDVRRAREAVLRALEPLGLWRDGAWRLDAVPRPKYPQTGLKPAKAIGHKHPELAALIEEPRLQAIVGDLLEGRPYDRSIYPRPQVLFTLPNADAWAAPNGWHVDSPRLASGRSPGVQLFASLDDVAPGGGATVVVAGSHRLLNEGRHMAMRDMRRQLVREPFFRELFSDVRSGDACELMGRRARIGDAELRLVELTGAPGDAWLVDLRVLHSAAPNAAERPRLMLTHRFVRADMTAEIAEAFGWTAADTKNPPDRSGGSSVES